MSWIFDHLNIVIVIALVIGSFLKSRFDSMTQGDQEPEEQPDYETYEEPKRQNPPSMPYVPPAVERTPPPVPADRGVAQPPVFAATRTSSGAMNASAEEAAAILKKQRDIEERLRLIRETRSAKSGAKAPAVRNRNSAEPSVPATTVPSSIGSRLRNPAEQRRAFVLREILDRPVGLR